MLHKLHGRIVTSSVHFYCLYTSRLTPPSPPLHPHTLLPTPTPSTHTKMTSFIPPFDFTDSPSSFHTTATSSPRTHNDPAARGDLTEELKRLSAATWLTTSTYDNDNVSIHSTSTMKPVPITLPANATTSQAAQPARRSPDNDASSSYAPDDSPEPILRTATPVRISRHRATTLVVCPPTPSSFTSESAASTTTREGSPCPDYRTQRHKELPALPITPVKRVRRRLTKRSVTSLPLEPPKQEKSPAGETTWRVRSRSLLALHLRAKLG